MALSRVGLDRCSSHSPSGKPLLAIVLQTLSGVYEGTLFKGAGWRKTSILLLALPCLSKQEKLVSYQPVT